MRHIIATLLIFCCTTLAIAHQVNSPATEATSPTGEVINKHMAARGYRGFVNYTPLTFTFVNQGIAGNISTTHGYQLNHNHFVGLGAGFHINLGDKGLGVAIPVYAAYKGNLGQQLAQLTYGARIGAAYADYGNIANEPSTHSGITTLAYFNASIGLRLGIARYFAINITPEIDVFTGQYSIIGAGLRLGIEF